MKRIIISLILLIIGAVAFQGFQCSSKEITTAKVKMGDKDYDSAIEYVNKELQNNPNSQEAYILLTDIYIAQNKWDKAAESSNKARKIVKDPVLMDQVKRQQNKIWTSCYNKGLNSYNMYISKTEKPYLDSAINLFIAGQVVRPEFEDFYYMTAITYEASGDTNAAIDNYKAYIEAVSEETDLMKDKGLFLNITRNEAISKLGEPTEVIGQKANRETDSIIVDYYKDSDKEFYAFYYSQKREPFELAGLRINPPDNWMPQEQKMFTELKKSPFAALSQIYFNRGDLENSLKYAQLITQLDPADQQVSRFVVELYTKLDKVDVAKEQLDEFIKNDPDNALYYAQYGDIHLNNSEYREAIEKYEKALDIDPNFAFALRNVASAYKNLASQIQDELQAKLDDEELEEIDNEKYFPYLRKSAQYFEKTLDTKEFKNDYLVLGELTNIYSVLENEEKLKATIKKLEAIEFSVPNESKENYYLILLKVYSDMGDEEKMNVIQKKYDRIK